jgi:salicylate hydroxylase
VTLASGKTHEADLVIGADGINGVVAPFLLGDKMDPAIYSGYSIFFGVIDDFDQKIQAERDTDTHTHTHPALPLPHARTLKEIVDHPAAIIQVLSPYKLFLVAGGRGKDKKLVWKLGYKTPNPPSRKAWVEEGSVRKELQAHLQRLREKEAGKDKREGGGGGGGCGGGGEKEEEHPVFSVLDSVLTRTKDTRLLHFGLFSRGHKPYWHQGRVVVIGDAAHATLPHLGQGANVSIEDAVVLAECLEAHRFRQVGE